MLKIFNYKAKQTNTKPNELRIILVCFFKISMLSKHKIEKWIICTSILAILTYYHLFFNEFSK